MRGELDREDGIAKAADDGVVMLRRPKYPNPGRTLAGTVEVVVNDVVTQR